jgi:hypothetical protein
MNSLHKSRLGTAHAVLVFVAALTFTGCAGPVSIGSDRCDVSACSSLPKPSTAQCADGTVAAPTGACVKSADGTCAWEVPTCAASCTPGATKPADDGCNQCTCSQSGEWECTLMGCVDPSGNSCVYDGKIHTEGETYPSTSPCNTCTCKNGENICTRNACTDPNACTLEECGGRPKCAIYTCQDGSMAGCLDNCYRDSSGTCHWEIRTCPTACTAGDKKIADDGCNECTCSDSGTWSCTDMFCTSSCVYDGKTYASGVTFTASDGCNECSCNEGQLACTDLACTVACVDGDPGFITGSCPACTVGANQTCNDDPLMSALAGTCVRNYCSCKEGFGLNPKNGKCTKATATAGSICTPNLNQTCNGNLEISSYQGRCLYDGTCACINDNELSPVTGKCVVSHSLIP